MGLSEQEELELLELEEEEAAARQAAPGQQAKQPFTLKRANEELYGAGGLTDEKVGAAASNALGVGPSGFSKVLPAAFNKAKGLKGLLGRVGAAGTEGAITGAAQSPEDRAKGAFVGAVTQGGSSILGEGSQAIRNWLSGASKQSKVNSAVKAGKSGEMLLGQADDAANKLRGEITGHEQELKGVLSPDGYEINPDMVADTFPRYAKKLEQKRPQVAVAKPAVMTRAAQQEIPLEGLGTETVMQPAAQGRVPLSAAQTRRLWKGANKASQFSQSDIMNPVAKAKSESAEALGDTIRREVYGKTPEAQGVMEQMGQDIQAKNYLTGRAVQKNPHAALSAEKLGTKKMEALMDIDSRVGTDLAKTGERMSKARALSAPLELDTASLGRLAQRAGYAAVPAVDGLAAFLGKATSPMTATTVRQGAINATRVPGLTQEEQAELDRLLREEGQ